MDQQNPVPSFGTVPTATRVGVAFELALLVGLVAGIGRIPCSIGLRL